MTALYIVSCVFDAFVIYLLFEDIFGKRKSTIDSYDCGDFFSYAFL